MLEIECLGRSKHCSCTSRSRKPVAASFSLRIKFGKGFGLFMDFDLVCGFSQYYVKLDIWILLISQAEACGYVILRSYEL